MCSERNIFIKSYYFNFSLPYRIVFAVGTEDSVMLYDTQQETPFAYVSNIHYHQISDLAWYVAVAYIYFD